MERKLLTIADREIGDRSFLMGARGSFKVDPSATPAFPLFLRQYRSKLWVKEKLALRLSLYFGLLVIATLTVCTTALGQVRVATWNVAGFRGEPADIFAVIDELSLDDHADAAAPLSVIVLQEVRNDDYQSLLNGLGAEWSAATYTNQSEDGYGGAQACFYRADQLLEVPAGHDDLYTGAGRRCDRWKFTVVGHNDPVTEFYLYSAHLKAGTTSSNQADRLTGANRILQDLAKFPANTATIVCGDFNVYTNSEPAYQALVGVLTDHYGTGSWGGASNAIKHSQSPRTISAGGLASGGMDDRFDLMLTTPTLAQTDGLSFIAGSMRSAGNDGQHYNEAINTGNNYYYPGELARSNTFADQLHDASDHIPVLADFRLPAVLEVTGGGDLGTFIMGGGVEATVTITNGAAASGADLHWNVPDTGDAGVLSPGASSALALPIEFDVPGTFDETLTIDADGDFVQHAPHAVQISGHILSHAVPSLQSDVVQTSRIIPMTVTAGTGIITETVSFWNHGWTANQARLDVDAIAGGIVGVIDAPTTLPSGVAGFPGSLAFSFNTDAMAPGNLFSNFSITTSDEDLPGAIEHSMSVTFTVIVEAGETPCDGDVNADGLVDISDLLALLDVWGSADADGDLNDDGVVNIDDLLIVLGDFGC